MKISLPPFLSALAEVTQLFGDATAIVDADDQTWSFRQLWEGANAGAEELKLAGVKAGELVALNAEPSARWIIDLLSVWMAHAAWFPISNQISKERRSYLSKRFSIHWEILRDQSQNLHVLKRPCDEEEVNFSIKNSSLAYVIPTSGSTGEPKGVRVLHRGIVGMLQDQILAFDLKPGSQCLWALDPSFDASMSDIGTSLLSGAELHIPRAGILSNKSDFLEFLTQRKITTMDIPPALLPIINPDECPASVRTVIIGGEVPSADAVRRWAKHVNLINVYGPTEATVCTSLMTCDANWSKPYLGQPLSQVKYLVLDENHHTVQDGQMGELAIGGSQVSDGYQNDLYLTEQRFIQIKGETYYLSGDRAIKDGLQFEFCGRIDRQFKIYGKLIAPEEIEEALLNLPEITEAHVQCYENESKKRIVAFVTLRNENIFDRDEVCERLLHIIPSWMIPHLFHIMTSIPKLPSGKPNHFMMRKALCSGNTSPNKDPIVIALEKVLGVVINDHFSRLEALGVDSFSLLELSHSLEKMGYDISPSSIDPTISVNEFRMKLENHHIQNSKTTKEIAGQFGPPKICSETSAAAFSFQPRDSLILITGSTGFLGRHVVRKLMDETSHFLVLLVRKQSPQLLKTRMIQIFGEVICNSSRIQILPSNLTEENFGLTDDQFLHLANNVSTILNLAGDIRSQASLDDLYEGNVQGLRQLIRFQKRHRIKRLLHASSLSVYVCGFPRRVASEDWLEPDDYSLHGGYAQSKWLAENFLKEEGIIEESCCLRLGLLVSDEPIPEENSHHILTLFLRSLLRSRAFPPELMDDLSFDLTPIDAVAEFVKEMVSLSTWEGKNVVHLCGKMTCSARTLLEVFEDRGELIQQMGMEEYKAHVKGLELSDQTILKEVEMALTKGSQLSSLSSTALFQSSGWSFQQEKNIFSRPHDMGVDAQKSIIRNYLHFAIKENNHSGV